VYYTYVLRNKKNGELYYGYTNDLDRRIKEHGSNNERKLIYYEAYLSEEDARRRERKLKDYGQARTQLKNRIKESLVL
jgi:putative endonuclease